MSVPIISGGFGIGAGQAAPFGGQTLIGTDGSVLPSATFSRASDATDVNSAGVLSIYAIDVLRMGYDGVTLAPAGLLIEGATTNLFPNQQIPNGSQVILTGGQPDSSGGTAAVAVVPSAVSGAHYLDRNIAMTAGTLSTFSVELTAGAASKASLSMYGTGNASFHALFDLIAGTFAAPTFTAEYTSGGGSFVGASMVKIGANKWRCSIAGVPDTAATTRLCRLSLRSIDGTTNAFAGDGTTTYLTYYGPQIEVGGAMTSYIPTPSGTASRALDRLEIGGAAFTNIFGVGAPAGCVIVDALLLQFSTTALSQYLIQLDSGSDGDRWFLRNTAGNTNLHAQSASGGVVGTATAVAGNFTAGVPFRVGLRWTGTAVSACFNGGAVQTVAAAPLAFVPNVLRLGNAASLTGPLNGRIRRVRAFGYSPSDAAFQAMCAAGGA